MEGEELGMQTTHRRNPTRTFEILVIKTVFCLFTNFKVKKLIRKILNLESSEGHKNVNSQEDCTLHNSSKNCMQKLSLNPSKMQGLIKGTPCTFENLKNSRNKLQYFPFHNL